MAGGIKAKGGKKNRKYGRNRRAPSNRNQVARTAANRLRRIAKAERDRNKNHA